MMRAADESLRLRPILTKRVSDRLIQFVDGLNLTAETPVTFEELQRLTLQALGNLKQSNEIPRTASSEEWWIVVQRAIVSSLGSRRVPCPPMPSTDWRRFRQTREGSVAKYARLRGQQNGTEPLTVPIRVLRRKLHGLSDPDTAA